MVPVLYGSLLTAVWMRGGGGRYWTQKRLRSGQETISEVEATRGLVIGLANTSPIPDD